MSDWLRLLNGYKRRGLGVDEALRAYAMLHVSFVHIHPFFDGNGRMARLLSNVPIIRSGYPPIIIPSEKRLEYNSLLATYSLKVGQADPKTDILAEPELLDGFVSFCKLAWEESMRLVELAYQAQEKRREKRKGTGDGPMVGKNA